MTDNAVSHGPARGYSWPPFEKGHKLSVRHGAFSDRTVSPLAADLVTGLLAEREDLGGFPEAVHAWADNAARWLLLREWLDEHGMFHGDKPREGPLKWLDTFGRRMVDLGRRLGLDPLAQAELARTRAEASRTAGDLDRLRRQGAEIMQRRTDGGGPT